jgi:hypothetical protein
MNDPSPGPSCPPDDTRELRIDLLEEQIRQVQGKLSELLEKHEELADLFGRVVHVLQHKISGDNHHG